jgi:drug/metabolite transporter (DMT)-like permease
MNGITWIHIAGGMLALVTGVVAVAVRKGSGMHVSAGTWFCVAMFVLGVTASILSPLTSPPESPIGGIMVCYFVATALMAARRRSGTPGRFEKIACAIVLAIAAAITGHGFEVVQAPPGLVSMLQPVSSATLPMVSRWSDIARRRELELPS